MTETEFSWDEALGVRAIPCGEPGGCPNPAWDGDRDVGYRCYEHCGGKPISRIMKALAGSVDRDRTSGGKQE